MKFSVKILLALNKLFKAPIHPLNLQDEGIMSYAMWQYKKGAETIRYYLAAYSEEDMFQNKTVLDIGCGAGGKSLYYASRGATEVIGIDILEKYRGESAALVAELGHAEHFRFVCGDAAALPFSSGSIDTIIMNDAMEHVAHPETVLAECLRVLAPGGKLFLNFPPIHHPFGAHLHDLIYIPWVHLLFSEKTCIEAYKALCKTVKDGDERIAFRISERADGCEYFSYINHMTVKRFDRILKSLGVTPIYRHTVPIRPFLRPFCHMRPAREFFTKMVVCVFEKQD